jgi:hypothetical protein
MFKAPVPRTVLPPYLIASHGVKLCSVCRHAFGADSKPSIGSAFKKHVLDLHRVKEVSGKTARRLK